MIHITQQISIDESELQVDFVQSSGPGGQNVNKVATAAQLRYNITGLPEDVRTRLLSIARGRITDDGILVIRSQRYRTQEQNRQAALQRLVELIRQAAVPPKPRRKTRPTLASKMRRLEEKRRRGQVKRLRNRSSRDDDG